MSSTPALAPSIDVATRFRTTRQCTVSLIEPLTPEDMMVQSCAEASPAKWHLAHTTWFFESFVLREFLPGYRVFNPDFQWLFNSYYVSFAAFPEKRLRSSFSRPSIAEILRYRAHVDAAIDRLLESNPDPEALKRIELGANHEEQHQELILTDILHALFTNPLRPAYLLEAGKAGIAEVDSCPAIRFVNFPGGLVDVGHHDEGFGFDNEFPRHRVWLDPYSLAHRLVTCGEYAQFIADGGYRRPEFWLSAGWDAVQQNGWRAPLYWSNPAGPDSSAADSNQNDWTIFTLRGERCLSEMQHAPVSHVSYYEADAYAHWAGERLATEFEWEAATEGEPVEGNLLDSGNLIPMPAGDSCPATALIQNQRPTQWWGDCWEWTASAYLGYPGFRPLPGSLGEYNGKFMSGQMVLRGGSCVTPAAHIRSTYRNFFSPETRWQFSGIRLAKAKS